MTFRASYGSESALIDKLEKLTKHVCVCVFLFMGPPKWQTRGPFGFPLKPPKEGYPQKETKGGTDARIQSHPVACTLEIIVPTRPPEHTRHHVANLFRFKRALNLQNNKDGRKETRPQKPNKANLGGGKNIKPSPRSV